MGQTELESIAGRHGIELLLQFGSSVSGHLHTHSDFDLAVLLARAPASFAAQADLIADLQRLAPDREVDVAILNRADPLFLERVTGRCKLLWGSPRRLQELKIYAFKRYQDHRPYLAMERDYVAAHLPSAHRLPEGVRGARRRAS
jgi:predicted nucleotidyltransferase